MRVTDLVRAVVEAHHQIADAVALLSNYRQKRECEISVRDGATEWALGGHFWVNVDPLVVSSGVGEEVDFLLRHLNPVAGSQFFSGGGLELVEVGESTSHGVLLEL